MSYDVDFVAWAERQAELLRHGRFEKLDRANLAEEIESLGKRERRELASRLTVLLTHLVKWQVQPEHRSRSWRATIANQRREIGALLEDSPSLRDKVGELVERQWAAAAEQAMLETGIEVVPQVSPWTEKQVLDLEFVPD